MLRSGLFLVIALLASGFVVSARLQAAEPKVIDNAKFFSQSAIEQATQKMREIHSLSRDEFQVVIETFPSIPANKKAQYDPNDKREFFHRWAETQSADEGVRGIYVLICRSPGYLEIEPDKVIRRKDFTLEERDALVKKALALMEQKKFDAALLEIVDSIDSTLRANRGQRTGGAAAPVQRFPNEAPVAAQQSGGLGGWICFGVVAILVIWLISAVMRAFRGGSGYGGMQGGGGPGGMGGGYGPGYGGGGGGGGFFSSLLGGMFGAAAGNWLYDSFRGSGQSSTFGAQSGSFGSSDTPTDDQTGSGDFGGDTDPGAGGSFGDDDSTSSGGSFDDGGGSFDDGGGGGGDFGGGGGDFGGGGGDFGGGDSGGGGGDSSW